jgi:endonuclease/exonuclease/phosphatase family metal-dependent hydrolase
MTLKIFTLNINFKKLTQERIERILALIRKYSPDIIFLQEVPREMVELFLQMEEYPYHFGTIFAHPYDTIILSCFRFIRYDRIPLCDTVMGRSFLIAQIRLPTGQIIFVGTFHLDSVFSPPQSELIKMDQLLLIQSIVKGKTFVIGGDTNLLNNDKIAFPNIKELDSLPTFKNNRFDRFFTSDDFTNSTAQIIGDSTHSDHRGLFAQIDFNLPEQ